jgi:hypothetical protein
MSLSVAELSTVLTHVADGFLSGGGADDPCCTNFAVPWKFIATLLLSVGIATFVTCQITSKSTATRVARETGEQLQASINTIFDEICKALERALLATGDAKSGEAQELYKKIFFYLGPILMFMAPVGAAVKALDDASKGEVAQELVCTGFNCDKRSGGAGPHPQPNQPQPHPQANNPSASASAAGGAAAAAAAAGGQTIIFTGGTVGGGNGSDNGSGSGMPSRRVPCDCGKGKLSDYVAPGKPTEKRRMTDKEKNEAARAAIEQFAEIWRKDAVTKQMHDIVLALSTVKQKKTAPLVAETINIYGKKVYDRTDKNSWDR